MVRNWDFTFQWRTVIPSPQKMNPTQSHRHAAVETALGGDALLLKSFSGREELGRLFDYHMVLLDPERNVDPDDLVGTNMTLRLELENTNTRYFHGYIASLAFLGYESGAGVYHAEVVPWLWLLTKTSDCRIFQEKTVKEIIEDCFKEHGFEDYKFGNYSVQKITLKILISITLATKSIKERVLIFLKLQDEFLKVELLGEVRKL